VLCQSHPVRGQLIIFSGTPFLFIDEILVDGAAKLDDNYFGLLGYFFARVSIVAISASSWLQMESPLPSA